MAFFVFPPPPPTLLPVSGDGLFPVRRVYGLGQNYPAHAVEMGRDPSRDSPFFFAKPTDSVTTARSIPFPPLATQLGFEGELVIAIGRGGSDIDPAQALEHVFGYTVGCDLTRRDPPAERLGPSLDIAKGFDLAGPVSLLHPSAEIGHPASARLTLSVNGAIRQDSDIAGMIWPVPRIVAELSRLIRLEAGDLIFSGTPAGVGWLERGDRVEVAIAGLTNLSFTIA